MGRRDMVRVLGAAVIVGASALGGASAASAADVVPAALDCNGGSAFSSITYRVDGVDVKGLRHNTHPGAKVDIDARVAAGCGDLQVGLATYTAPSGSWDAGASGQQTLVDGVVARFADDGARHHVSVVLPTCDYQVDFVTGPIIQTLSAINTYSNGGRLVDADNGDTANCVAPTTTTTTTQPTQVLGESVVRPEVAGASLASTGFDPTALLGAGASLTGVGVIADRFGRRLRKQA